MARPMQTQQPKILILATLAGGYAGADSTGQSHLDYPANTYILPVMCPVMFPPEFFVRAFEHGIDGIIIMYSGTDSPYKVEADWHRQIDQQCLHLDERAQHRHPPLTPGGHLYRLCQAFPERSQPDERPAQRDRLRKNRNCLPRRFSTRSASMKDLHIDALIVGGGIAGMQSALDLGDQGFQVALVEREPSIGGKMITLSKVFPTLDCCSCITTPKMSAVAHHPNIQLFTYCEVQSVDENGAGFDVTILKKPRYVDESKCTGCRQCEYECPITVPSPFDRNLGCIPRHPCAFLHRCPADRRARH